MRKYNYYKVIQQNWGNQWDDVDFYECDSAGFINDKETRDSFRENLRLYRQEQPVPTRVIKRRELNQEYIEQKQDLDAEIVANIV